MKPLNIFIREIREDNDLKQTDVAKALGIAQQYYSKYEAGEYELPIRHLINLTKLYKLNSDYILQLTKFKYSLDKLNKPFLENISVSSFLSDVIQLNMEQRKFLLDFVHFLNNK